MKYALLSVVMLLIHVARTQDDASWRIYYGGMELNDGIYADFQAFRMNAPTVPIAALRDDQGHPVSDIRRALSKLYYQSDSSERKMVRKENLWGFCQNNAIYIAAGNGFYRIGLMGSLGHMVYELTYNDWDPYMHPYGNVTRTAVMHQLLDMEGGIFLPFNASGMEQALVHDHVLQEEFRNLPKKQRNSNEALFRFLRLYNERNPLRFPQ